MSFLGGGSNAASPNIATGIPVSTSLYGTSIPIIYGTNRSSDNLIWYNNFSHSGGSSGGKGGGKGGSGGKGSGSQIDYKASLMLGICEGPIAGINNVYVNNVAYSLSSTGFSLFTGSYPQSVWGYLTSAHPDQARQLNGQAYVAASNYDLGSSAQTPQHNFEVQGILIYGGGILDADPSAFIPDFLTNNKYGVGFPSSLVGDFTQYHNYCVANGLFMSGLVNSQQDAATYITNWCQLTNSDPCWRSGTLQILPRGDQTITGNGATFTPNLTPNYAWTDNDYVIKNPGDVPVSCTRSDPADAFNEVTVQYRDRTQQYMDNTAKWQDQTSIDTYGLRAMTGVIQADDITLTAVAAFVAQLIGQRQLYVRNKYSFTLDARYCLVEVGDYNEITDTALGLSQQLVRVTAINENADNTLDLTVEEVPGHAHSAPLYNTQANSGYNVNFNADPGSVNPPVFALAPLSLTDTQFLLWVALSGGAQFGGAEVWISSDGGASYRFLATNYGNSCQGVTTNNFLVESDPDNTSVLGVDLTESLGSLTSGVITLPLSKLSYVGDGLGNGELIAYTTATLTAANKYNLTTLRRGLYDSPILFAAAASQFWFVNSNTDFHYPFPVAFAGQTIYFKFLAFNKVGANKQQLAAATAYPFTFTERFTAAPTGVSFVENSYIDGSGNEINAALLSWTDSASPWVTGYQVQWMDITAGGAWINSPVLPATATSYQIQPVIPGHTYAAQVAAIPLVGPNSAWAPAANLTIFGYAVAMPAFSNVTVYYTPNSDGGISHVKINASIPASNAILASDSLVLFYAVDDFANQIGGSTGGVANFIDNGSNLLVNSFGPQLTSSSVAGQPQYTILAGSTSGRLVVRPANNPLDTSFNLAGMFWAQFGASAWRKITSFDGTGFNFLEPFDIAPVIGATMNWVETPWHDERQATFRLAAMQDVTGTQFEVVRWGEIIEIGGQFYIQPLTRAQEGTTQINGTGGTLSYYPAPGAGTTTVVIPLAGLQLSGGVYSGEVTLPLTIPPGKFCSGSACAMRTSNGQLVRSNIIPLTFGGPL